MICLWVACPPRAAQHTLGSTLARLLTFKITIQVLGYGRNLHWSSEKGSHCARTDASFTQKCSHTRTQGHGVWSQQTKQPMSQLAALSRCLCTYTEGQGREMAPVCSFVPREVLQRKQSFPIPLRRSSDCTVCP